MYKENKNLLKIKSRIIIRHYDKNNKPIKKIIIKAVLPEKY